MSINAKVQQFGKSIIEIIQQVSSFILAGFQNIFAPSKDKYPAVGVQPFEGNHAKKSF